MTATEPGMEFRSCRSCGNVGIGDGDITCCDRPMKPIDLGDATLGIEEPTLQGLLGDVFDISETELDVCLCVMEAGATTVADLADEIDYDRSIVSRHLNHLVDLGVLEKRRRILEGGGQIYVYVPADEAAIRRSFRLQFLAWCERGIDLIDDLNREKVEAILEADRDGEPTWTVFHEE